MAVDARLTTIHGARPLTLKLRLPAVIGRSLNAGVRVPHALVSRRHCALYEEADALIVRDLGSANGTYVNDVQIRDTRPLQSGDRLRIGAIVFQVDIVTSPQSTSIDDPSLRDREPAMACRDDVVPQADSAAHAIDSVLESFPVLQYRELADGSVLEIDTGQDMAERIEEFPGFGDGTVEREPVSDIHINVGQREGKPSISGDESALDQFLRNLDR